MRRGITLSVRELFTRRVYPVKRQRTLILVWGGLLVGFSLFLLTRPVGEAVDYNSRYFSLAHLLLGCGVILSVTSDFFLDRAFAVAVALRVLAVLAWTGMVALFELSRIFSPGVFVAICAVFGIIAYAAYVVNRRDRQEER